MKSSANEAINTVALASQPKVAVLTRNEELV
jgi:hypothetical protein